MAGEQLARHGPSAGRNPRAIAPAGTDTWRQYQVFPGERRQLAVVRRWLKSILPDCPAREAVISVANELASNAVLHTSSGEGGSFGVEITSLPALICVAVADGGALAGPRMVDDPAGEHGRGLLLVAALSARTGVRGSPRGRVVWAEIAWDGASPGSPYPHEDASAAAALAALAARFPGVPAWFGASTAQWWALVGSELVAASSPQDLADRIADAIGSPQEPVPGRIAPARLRRAPRHGGPEAS